MSHSPPTPSPALDFLGRVANATNRRTFLQWAGLTVGVAALGCGDDNGTGPNGDGVDLGSGDIGVLNYAYALEQLEAAFYVKVLQSPYTGMTAEETQILTDIRDHEIIHREFLKAALGTNAIGALEVDFTSITFSSRASVLGAAKAFEDLGVSAYNGAGQFLSAGNYLLTAGKIVSVEARHAAIIRDLLATSANTGDFAGDDVVDATGLDVSNLPSVVLSASKAGAYVTTEIDFSHLPTS